MERILFLPAAGNDFDKWITHDVPEAFLARRYNREALARLTEEGKGKVRAYYVDPSKKVEYEAILPNATFSIFIDRASGLVKAIGTVARTLHDTELAKLLWPTEWPESRANILLMSGVFRPMEAGCVKYGDRFGNPLRVPEAAFIIDSGEIKGKFGTLQLFIDFLSGYSIHDADCKSRLYLVPTDEAPLPELESFQAISPKQVFIPIAMVADHAQANEHADVPALDSTPAMPIRPLTDEERITQQLAKWKGMLINLDRRNRLLFYKPTKASTIEFVELKATSIVQRIYGPHAHGVRIVPSSSERGREYIAVQSSANDARAKEFDPAIIEKCLRNLDRKASQLWLDRGIWSLYLGCGMLEWQESSGEETEPDRSPIFLFPVELEHEGATGRYTLVRSDEEPALNPALIAKLKLVFDIDLSTEEEIDSESLPGLLNGIRDRVAGLGWKVRDEAILASFTFHKDAMYKDLEANADLVVSNPLLRTLVLGSRSGYDFSFDFMPMEDLDEKAPPEEMVTILDADSSQRQAILAAREGRSFVLDGPPGTGKSQTIANIIAELIAAKKCVLFVSEKAAALEVVKKRLDAAGLSDLILELHSHKATRKEVAKNLGAALNTSISVHDPMFNVALHRLRYDRRELMAWGTAVNEVREDLGISLQEAIGRVSCCAELPIVPAAKLSGSLTKEKRKEISDLATALSMAWSPVDLGESFVWDRPASKIWSVAAGDTLRSLFADCDISFETLTALAGTVAEELTLPIPEDLGSLETLNQVEELLERRPAVSARLLAESDLEGQLAEINDLIEHASRLKQARGQLDTDAGVGWEKLRPESSDEFEGAIKHIVDCDLGWLPPEDVAASSLSDRAAFYMEYASRTGKIIDSFGSIRAMFSQNRKGPSLAEARDLLTFAKELGRKRHPLKEWLDRTCLDMMKQGAPIVRAVLGQLHESATRIAPKLSEAVIEIDMAGISSRYAAYGFFRFLSRDYWRDKAALGSYSVGGKFFWKDRAILSETCRFKECHESYLKIKNEWHERYGRYWQDRETNMGIVEDALALAELGLDWFKRGFELSALRMIFGGENASALLAIRDSAEVLDTELVTLDARIGSICPDHAILLEDYPLDAFSSQALTLSECHGRLSVLVASTERLCQKVKGLAKVGESLENRSTVALEEAWFANRAERLGTDFPELFRSEDSSFESMKAAIAWCDLLRKTIGEPIPGSMAEAILIADQYYTKLNAALQRTRRLLELIRAEIAADSRLGHRWIATMRVSSIRGLLSLLAEHLDEVPEAQRYYDLKVRLSGLGLGEAIETAVGARLAKDQLVKYLDASCLTPWIEYAFGSDQRLANRSHQERDGILQEFRSLDQKYIQKCAAVAIRASHDMRPINRTGGWGIIHHQAGLQRRHKPVKKLMEEAGPEIRKLKPCFMMSPLSVSQFIPSRMRFDAVIFDEASQVKPEDAINSIYRGAQLIVAGDRNQLPPTSFFEQTQDQGDEYLGDDEASSWESVLDLCTGNAAFREIPLLWHYRSRHEHLIAFSNHVFYDGRLVTFPGAMNEGGDVGVEFFHVPDGIYRRNLTRDNEKEARFVSERVIHHLAHHRDLTIGIVALSEPQASMIEQILEIALANHPELRERMRKDRLDGLFVKNLETVQGDERDLIILSVGYGHDANGILTQNFGPMNQKNGWRRLNVAITRARKRIEVIASIMPSEIIDSGGERSIVFLRKYLEYASSNTSRLEVIGAMFGSGKQERESPFEDSIAHAIVKMGYSVETQVGCSGYRMDIAVRHPQDPSQYVLAVECDGATYHSTKVVRDRDRLRQEVLKGLGWDVWRIWSSSWYQSRRTQEQLLEKAIQDAVSRHPVTNVTAFSPAVSQTEKEQIALGTGTYVQGSESSSVQDIIEDISKQESTEREVAENPYPQEDPVDIIASVSPSRSTAYHAPPRNLSVESLVAYLESFGFSVDNKRPLGGSLWVYLSEERFSEMSEILRANGIVLKFYPHGRTRKPGEQWEIDPGKRLG